MTRTQKIRALRTALKEFERGVKMPDFANESDIDIMLRFMLSYNGKYESQREEQADEVLREIFKEPHN